MLAFEETGKYVSENHYIASKSKLTAGEAVKVIFKKTKIKILAKELPKLYYQQFNDSMEWHHSGFYSSNQKGKQMGKTYFISEKELAQIIDNINELLSIISLSEKPKIDTTNVFGFYYVWGNDYGGNYGKKRAFKILQTYEGIKGNTPKNFTEVTERDLFEKINTCVGKKYFGWSEPTITEFI